MRFSYPIGGIGSLKDFSGLLKQYSGGNFPIGSSLTWHGGVHIETEEKRKENKPIVCIADGAIVAYRFSKDYKTYGEESVPFSNNFVLVQHHYKSPNNQKLVFYSLYQHLRPQRGIVGDATIPPFLSETADDGTITWRKDAVSEGVRSCNITVEAGEIIGYGGHSGAGEGNPKLVHLEIFTADEGLENFISNTKEDGIRAENNNRRISNPHASLPDKLQSSFPCDLLGDTQITVEDDENKNKDHYRIKIGSVRRVVDRRELGDFTRASHGFSTKENTTIFGGLPQKGDTIKLLITEAQANQRRDRGDYSRPVEYAYPSLNGRTFWIEKKYLEKTEKKVSVDPLGRPLSRSYDPETTQVPFRIEPHYRLRADGSSDVVRVHLRLHCPSRSKDRVTEIGNNNIAVPISPENTVIPPGINKPWHYIRSYVYDNVGTRKAIEGYFEAVHFPAHSWNEFGFKISKIDQDRYLMDLENPSPLLQKILNTIKKEDEKMLRRFWFTRRCCQYPHMFALSRHIFLHRSDWAYTTDNDTVNLKEEYEEAICDYIRKKAKTDATKKHLEEKGEEKIKLLVNLAKELSFWSEIKIDTERNPDLTAFPGSPDVYHFHPIAFIEQMMKTAVDIISPMDHPHIGEGVRIRERHPRTGAVGVPHNGVDITNYKEPCEGKPVYAPVKGRVTLIRNCNATTGTGTTIRIRDERDNIHIFMHLQYNSIKVKKDALVEKGAIIASVGNTGASTGAHLHYEIRDKSNLIIDPLAYNVHLRDNARLRRGTLNDYAREWENYKNSNLGSNLSTKYRLQIS